MRDIARPSRFVVFLAMTFENFKDIVKNMSASPFNELSKEKINIILRERTLKLAKSRPLLHQYHDTLEALQFTLGEGTYAMESKFVKGVHKLKDLAPLPFTPPHLMGLVNIRRKIMALVDLQILFGLPRQEVTSQKKILVVAEEEIEFALLIDDLIGVNSINLENIEFSLSDFSEQGETYLKGVTTGGIAIIDGSKLINSPKLIVNNPME